MEIIKKDFDNLKQLDRIEYRQKEERIHKRFECGMWNFIWYMMIIDLLIGLMAVVSLQYDLQFETEVSLILFDASGSLSCIIFFFIIINILVGIIYSIMERNKITELENTYFKIEVKK